MRTIGFASNKAQHLSCVEYSAAALLRGIKRKGAAAWHSTQAVGLRYISRKA
jgi:hypothetical protein